MKIWPVDLHTYSYFVNLKRRVKVFLKVLRTFITSIVRYGQTQYITARNCCSIVRETCTKSVTRGKGQEVEGGEVRVEEVSEERK